MKKNKVLTALLCASAAMALTGCGDEVEITMDKASANKLISQGYEFSKQSIVQMKPGLKDEGEKIKNAARDARSQFSNEIEKTLASKDKAVDDKYIEEAREKAMEQYDKLGAKVDKEWAQKVETITAAYAPEEKKLQEAITVAQAEYDKHYAYYAKEDKALKDLDAAQKAEIKKQSEADSRYTEIVRKDIIDNERPVALQKQFSMRYNDRGMKNNACPEYKGASSDFSFNNRCYYFKTPYAEFTGTDGYKESVQLLKEKLTARYNQNEYYLQKRPINIQLKNKQTVANNKFGQSQVALKRNVTNSKNNLKRHQDKLERETNEYMKERFAFNHALLVHKEAIVAIEKASHASVAERLSEFVEIHSSDEENGSVEINPEIKDTYAVVEYKKKGKDDYISSLMPIEPELVLEADRPITFSTGVRFGQVRGQFTPKSKSFAMIVL